MHNIPVKDHPLKAAFEKSIARARHADDKAILEFLFERNDTDCAPFGSINLKLHHGTPQNFIDPMLIDGIAPQEHEILGGNWFCVSPNENVLRYFGDGGVHGFIAEDVILDNCLFLTKRQVQFFLDVCCGDRGPQSEINFDWFESRSCDYDRLRSDDIGHAWKYLPKELDAFVWPDCYEHLIPHWGWQGNDGEAEISLTENGCKKFQKAITEIVRNNNYMERPEVLQMDFPCLRYAA